MPDPSPPQTPSTPAACSCAGGQVEAGESPEVALVRELQEELELRVDPASLRPITFASHSYDTFHLLMPLFGACPPPSLPVIPPSSPWGQVWLGRGAGEADCSCLAGRLQRVGGGACRRRGAGPAVGGGRPARRVCHAGGRHPTDRAGAGSCGASGKARLKKPKRLAACHAMPVRAGVAIIFVGPC